MLGTKVLCPLHLFHMGSLVTE